MQHPYSPLTNMMPPTLYSMSLDTRTLCKHASFLRVLQEMPQDTGTPETLPPRPRPLPQPKPKPGPQPKPIID
ncbi:hypothetical protein ACJZ2D_004802 [Fusarium nematophilum]